jgi:CRISPR-associated protein Cmr4
LPVPSLSHGVVWITSPLLLRRWTRLTNPSLTIPPEYSCSFKRANRNVYLKDAILKDNDLKDWSTWSSFIPQNSVSSGINQVLVLPDQHCTTLIQMSLWRQVKIKLDEHKSVDGGFRYEEAIPPDTLMYFPWGITSQANGTRQQSQADFKQLLADNDILQIGGQESLGRGFVQQW